MSKASPRLLQFATALISLVLTAARCLMPIKNKVEDIISILCLIKGAPDPVAREVYRGLLCLRKTLQKPTDSVPQQDCEYQKLKSGCKN